VILILRSDICNYKIINATIMKSVYPNSNLYPTYKYLELKNSILYTFIYTQTMIYVIKLINL
jgi:hypothetical protein